MHGTTPVEETPEPRRETFKEKALPGEPRSDVRVVAKSGMTLRERVQRVQSGGDVTFRFTYTKLDAAGNVAADPSGNPIITDPHEVMIDGEAATRIGPDGVTKAIEHGREVAVARAVDHFNGLASVAQLFAGRLA